MLKVTKKSKNQMLSKSLNTFDRVESGRALIDFTEHQKLLITNDSKFTKLIHELITKITKQNRNKIKKIK